jgi:hypothetical protein
MNDQAALTVNHVCVRYGIKPEKVLAWIHSGQLRALNLNTDPKSPRPRWRILSADLEAFERIRCNLEPAKRGRPRKAAPAVKEFV